MTKDVLISISGLQFDMTQNDPSEVEVISVGQYYFKNKKHFVQYDEILVESSSIEDSITKSTVKISDKQVDVLKRGSSNVHMVFEIGKKNMTYYNTPFGTMLMGIYTNQIKTEELDDKIVTKIDYTLEVNYVHVSDCKIVITVKSKEK